MPENKKHDSTDYNKYDGYTFNLVTFNLSKMLFLNSPAHFK